MPDYSTNDVVILDLYEHENSRPNTPPLPQQRKHHLPKLSIRSPRRSKGRPIVADQKI